MLARSLRSGVVEATHDGSVAITMHDGALLASWGNVDNEFYYRSAIKPVQAWVAQEHGAGLGREQLAIACSSHSGHPIHIEYVRAMLAEAGLGESTLQCPPAWPLDVSAQRDVARRRVTAPAPILHNCSGKHAAMLRACVASGWPIETYTSPDHPLQVAIAEAIAEVASHGPHPAGVDGCGVPTFRATVVSLATAFARLSWNDRFSSVAVAMTAYPALVGGNGRADSEFGRWWGGPAKGGAMGSMAAGRNGLGVAAKAATGDTAAAVVGTIAAVSSIGALSDAALRALDDIAAPPVLGGGRPVGALEPALE